MNSSELLIRPVILEDDERPQDFDYPLVDINLVLTSHIPSVYVMRGQLDIRYLGRAIAIAAGRMRATCGRVVKLTDGKHPYGIRFTDSPVSLTTASCPDVDKIPNRDVVQDDLSAWLPPVDPSPVDEVRPLLSFKLTKVEAVGEPVNVLGVLFHHCIGDADLASQFNGMLSTIYSALVSQPDADVSSFSLPFFTTAHVDFRQPTQQEIRDRWLIQAYPQPLEKGIKMYTDLLSQPTEMIVITLTGVELQVLKERIGVGCEEPISAQDALSAWFVELVRSTGEEVQRAINTINYRSMHPLSKLFPFPLKYCTGNVVQMCPVAIPSPGSPSATATALRAKINHLKNDVDEVEAWLANAAYQYRRAVDEGGLVFFGADPQGNEVVLNSNLRFNWLQPFGMDVRRVSFHTTWSAPRFLRVFKPNPNPETPGVEADGAEMAFRAPIDKAPALKELVKSQRASLWASWSEDQATG